MKTKLNSTGFRALIATQFLGAFNDNAFKLVVSFALISFFTRHQMNPSGYIALAGLLFILPFVVFSSYAGFLADRYSKKRVMIGSKIAELLIMVFALVSVAVGNIYLLLFVLFLMGAQSAFFSPAKYGILPEIFPEEDLSRANGSLQMWTFMAIILGTVIGGQLAGAHVGLSLSAVCFIVIAVAGCATSLLISPVNACASGKPFEMNFIREMARNFKEIHAQRALYLCVLGSVYFWFLGALFQMNMLLYAKELMSINESMTAYLLTSVALGIGIGSYLAGRWSEDKIEFGLVPLGAIGMGIFSVALGFVYISYTLTLVVFFMLGISSALFNIPLNAYIQEKSPNDSKGRMIAATNFFSFCAMILSSVVLWLLSDLIGLNPAMIFLVMGLLSFFVITYICRLLPDFLMRFVVWLLTHIFYRIRIIGKEHIPKTGGALLVCNHVSFIDGFLIMASMPRFVRFLVYRDYYEMKFLRPLFAIMKAIPISENDPPKKIIESLTAAREALNRGELVCIFAEGEITRTGNILKFNNGFEQVMKRTQAPIIPVHLDRVWGSIFSYKNKKFFYKVPEKIPYPVTVSFGSEMPSTSKAIQVRQAISELSCEAVKLRIGDMDLLPLGFLRKCRRHAFKPCLIDENGKNLSFAKTFISSFALMNSLRKKLKSEQNIGIMLPNSIGAALSNIALSLNGKVGVNLNYTLAYEALEKISYKCGLKTIISSKVFMEKTGKKPLPGSIWLEDCVNKISYQDKFKAICVFLFLPIRLYHYLYLRHKTADELATIMFSSGSTGIPKGVMLSHRNIVSNIEGLYQLFQTEQNDILMGILPFFHSFGFTANLWYSLTIGITALYYPNPLDFKVIGELVHRHKASILMSTPTFLMGYIRQCSSEQFQSLRHVFVGAEKLKPRIAESFNKKFGLDPFEGYGCTELSPIVTVNVRDIDDGGIHQTGYIPGSIGHPLPGIAVKVVDVDTMEEKPVNSEGLLLVKGPNVMMGYLGDPDSTNEVMKGAWYITGDIASMDENGFIIIKDRLSRFSKIGGEMVPHIKIEETLHELVNCKNEQIFAVCSVPDEKKGEALVVLYKGDLDTGSVYDQLLKTDLPRLWMPKKDAFFQVDDIPVLG
ncbi:MAG: acyl-[ACP]--phospholipid O-acyltransferase, partial [Chlamydiota bacterium]|nr:acyl-[ACP]--phospholipid O-acyltransferase [Chlamydiota bacterium]